MRTGTKLNDGGPYRNMLFASVTYTTTWRASAGWAVFPGLKRWAEWHEVKASLGCFIAPDGLKNLAQGFNPGKHSIKRFALKGREMA